MAKGYWEQSYWPSCPCCSSGPKAKFICAECLHVCKAPKSWTPHCPKGHGEMINMGQRWRPAKKNKRVMPEVRVYQGWPKPGVTLLDKIMAKPIKGKR